MAINQSLTLTQVSQNVANRTSTIRILWTTTQTGSSYNNYEVPGYYWVSVNGGAETKYTVNTHFPLQSTKTIVDTSIVVEHDSNGECTVDVRTSINTKVSAGTITKSASLTLDTIHQASTLAASNGVLGEEMALTISSYDDSFTHSIRYDCGTASVAVCTKISDRAITFTPPLNLAKQNTTGATVALTFTLYTFDGDTEIGRTTKTITCTIPAEVKPSCSVMVTDPTGYEAEYGFFIKGVSKFAVTITPELAYDAPIVAYTSTADGARYSLAEYTTDVLKSAGDLTIYAAVTDSRNRSGTDSIVKTVLDYSAPVVSSLTVHRCDADGTENDQGEYVRVDFAYSISDLNGKNAATVTVHHKKSSETAYTLGTIENNVCIFPAASGSSYDVLLTVADNITETSKVTSASTATTIMHFRADGKGVAFGKVSEETNVLELAWDLLVHRNITVKGGGIELNKDGTLANFGGFVDFHFNGSTDDYTARIIEDEEGKLNVAVTKGLYVNGKKVFTAGNLADYVTGTGSTETDGITWHWTTWNSGKVEMFATASVTPTNTATGGNTFYTNEISLTIPVSVSSGIVTGTANNQAWITNAGVSGTALTFRIGRGQTISTETAITVQLRVDGFI